MSEPSRAATAAASRGTKGPAVGVRRSEASPGALADAAGKAAVLAEALPYMRRYAGKTIVVKYGGHAMGDAALGDSFAHDIVLLKQVGINPIVVHGGGPQIGQMLERLKIKSAFIDGLRVTDQATVEIVEMVLSGSINKQIVAAINRAGGTAIGLSGKDGRLITARKLERTKRDPDSNIEKVLDLGFVGEPEAINAGVLGAFARSDIIPVIAPIGIGRNGETFNINADTVAGAVAAAVRASRLLLLTDVAGVLDRDKKLVSEVSVAQARALIADGTISGGMIPKIETCLDSVDGGVEAAVILDGRTAHAILLELFTEGAGTLIRGARA
jgi:acetylglutamate kinase